IMDAYALGYGEPIPISAAHGQGFNAVASRIFELLGTGEDAEEDEVPEAEGADNQRIHIAIIVRPNAGKSTFMNALLKEERVLTGPEAGITRDSIAVDTYFQNRAIKLIDTAG